MGKFSYWNVKFPSKTLVFSEVAFAFRKLAYMSPALTKPCFSQLQSSPGIPCWCWDMRPYQSSSACWTQSVELLVLCVLPPLSPPGFLMSLETICEATLSFTYLRWGQTPHVSSLLAAFARLAGCQLVGPGKSSSRARICLKMLGICLNTAFHQTLGFFLGLWGTVFTAPLDPRSAESV